jgi:hypothetical protein
MPARLLRTILATYSVARRISMLGSVSEEVCTSTAVVPGSAFAIFILHAILVTPCDDLLRVHQRLNASLAVAKFVDDIAISVSGTSKDALDLALCAFDWLVARFDSIGMEVSLSGPGRKRGKTVALVSNRWLHLKLSLRNRARGLVVTARARNLGITHSGFGSTRGAVKISLDRVKSIERRRKRIAFAKRCGGDVSKVAKMGLKAAATYGQRAVGLDPKLRLRIRRQISAAQKGSHRGRSLTLRLAVSGAEILHDTRAEPIEAWATAVWDSNRTEDLGAAWLKQTVKHAAGTSWKLVQGPAATCLAIAREMGWAWPAWHSFITREKILIDMRVTCPRDLAAMAR